MICLVEKKEPVPLTIRLTRSGAQYWTNDGCEEVIKITELLNIQMNFEGLQWSGITEIYILYAHWNMAGNNDVSCETLIWLLSE